jgi:hypothetical protein
MKLWTIKTKLSPPSVPTDSGSQTSLQQVFLESGVFGGKLVRTVLFPGCVLSVHLGFGLLVWFLGWDFPFFSNSLFV